MRYFIRRGLVLSGLIALPLIAISCGKSSNDRGVVTTAQTTVNMKADFASSAKTVVSESSKPGQLYKQSACPGSASLTDDPALSAGLDCDGDSGIVQYITPQRFKVAFKRLTFVKDDGSHVDIIPDRGTLANSLVFDITSLETITQKPVAEGTYSSFQAELYYYEIKMPINSAPEIIQSLRVYLSDDDFPAEGSLGHHQGDITFINANGTEIGWVGVATPWVPAALQTDKSAVDRPGSIDSETGHKRGLFGDTTLWNQAAFKQGNGKDLFLMEKPLGLVISGTTGKTVTFTFSTKDSWFFEDFDGNQKFNPCETIAAKDACAQNAEWAPIFSLPAITIQ